MWERFVLTETNKNDKSDDGEGLDAVQPKAVKKKFINRKDKDIDNDGDTDSSDEYLHKRRKAISKAIATKEDAVAEKYGSRIDPKEIVDFLKELIADAKKKGDKGMLEILKNKLIDAKKEA